MYEQDVLKHYGVLGMKWGVRKSAGRAYRKANAQRGKFESAARRKSAKAAKLDIKVANQQMKALKQEMKGNYAKASKFKKQSFKLQKKSAKLRKASAKATKRGAKWMKQMEKYFDSATLSSISAEDKQAGRDLYLKYAAKG